MYLPSLSLLLVPYVNRENRLSESLPPEIVFQTRGGTSKTQPVFGVVAQRQDFTNRKQTETKHKPILGASLGAVPSIDFTGLPNTARNLGVSSVILN